MDVHSRFKLNVDYLLIYLIILLMFYIVSLFIYEGADYWYVLSNTIVLVIPILISLIFGKTVKESLLLFIIVYYHLS